MADLAVIVVSHNSREWLEPCFASVYAHAGAAELDVVLVDNASSDGSADLVEEKFPDVRVLRCPNLGFAYGNNRGLLTVDAPFVLFLNADAEIVDGTLGGLVGRMREQPALGLVGCRQLTHGGEVYPTIRRFPTALRLLCESFGAEHLPFRARWLGERELDLGAYERETGCDWTSGSFMLARREAVLAAGLMDERFFLYCEEPDLCLRMRKAGYRVMHLPDLTIRHPWGEAGFRADLIAQEAYAHRQYFAKHFGLVHRVAATLALAAGHAVRSVTGSRDATLRRDRRRASRAALRVLLGISPPPFGDPASLAVAPTTTDPAPRSVVAAP